MNVRSEKNFHANHRDFLTSEIDSHLNECIKIQEITN